jgi:hypothetical protein
MRTDARSIGRLAGGQGALIVGLLGLVLVGWLITDRRMARHGRGAGHGSRDARVLHHCVGGDDGGDDVFPRLRRWCSSTG